MPARSTSASAARTPAATTGDRWFVPSAAAEAVTVRWAAVSSGPSRREREMSVKPADLVAIQFTTQSPTTGALTSADSLPTGVLVQNGADTAEVVTVALVSTGVYSASVTIPVGYVAGDEVQIRVAATVATVAGAAVVWSAVLDGLRVADLDLTDLPTIASDVAGLDGAAMRGTDNAYTGTPPTVEGIASQVRVELAAELALVDAAVTSREATGAAAGAVAGLAVEGDVGGHGTAAPPAS